MNQNVNLVKPAAILCTFFAMFMFMSSTNAQEWSRKGKSEVFGYLQQLGSDTTSGLGIDIKVDESTVFGMGYGNNLSEQVNANGYFFFGSTDLISTSGAVSISSDTTMVGYGANLDLYAVKGRVTPLVTAGIGFINFSGDVNGLDFSETDFSYNIGVGVRWNPSDKMMIKALYRTTVTKLEDSDKAVSLDGIGVFAGLVF